MILVLSLIVIPPFLLVLAMLLLDSLFRLVFLKVVALGAKEPSLPAVPQEGNTNIAYLFPAHDEGSVIAESIAGLAMPTYVIADNCQDNTAEAARRVGARVWERRGDKAGGKAEALRWFLNAAADEVAPYARLAIFDADSRVDPHFLDRLTAAPYDQALVVQGFVQPIVSSRSPVARLAAYSEILSQRIDDLARERLGWPVPLRGTGMVFHASLLPALLSELRTKVEDVEMTILLLKQGIHPRFLHHAVVGDPKPAGIHGVAAQRARWEQGRRQIWRYYWRDLLRLFFSGHLGVTALALSLVLRPRSLVLMLKVLLAVVFGTMAWSHAPIWSAAAVMLWIAIIIDGFYYLIGLIFVEERCAYALALLFAPAYLFMWIWSQTWSFVSRSAWLSVRAPRN